MSREFEFDAIWAPEPHRRGPRRASGPHRRHAWAPILGVRIDGVHPLTVHPSGHRMGVASRDGRLRIAARRSASGRPSGGHHRRFHSELPE